MNEYGYVLLTKWKPQSSQDFLQLDEIGEHDLDDRPDLAVSGHFVCGFSVGDQ